MDESSNRNESEAGATVTPEAFFEVPAAAEARGPAVCQEGTAPVAGRDGPGTLVGYRDQPRRAAAS